MCLAQGPQCSEAGEAQTHGPHSGVKHSATALPQVCLKTKLECMALNVSHYFMAYNLHILREVRH